METQQAYQAYLIQAQQNADFMNTILWLLFTIFVIAPLLTFFAYIIFVIFFRKDMYKD